MASMGNFLVLMLCVLGTMSKGLERDVFCDDDMAVFSNFEISQYNGKWFEVFRYDNLDSIGSECASVRYTSLKENPISVRNIEIVNSTVAKSVDGYMNLVDPESLDAKLTIDFPVQKKDIPYWIIDTDYETYSLVYSCQNDKSSSTPKSYLSAWILSRSTSLNGASMPKVNVAMKKAQLSWSSMRPMLHTKEACSGASIQNFSIAVFLISIAYSTLFQ